MRVPAHLTRDSFVRRQASEIERLEAENAWLRESLQPPGYLPLIFGFTVPQENAVKALLSRRQWSRDALHASIYLNVPEQDAPEIKMVDVVIFKIRKKLKPFGITIETYFGRGFGMSADMRAQLISVIAAEFAKEGRGANAFVPAGDSWVELEECA